METEIIEDKILIALRKPPGDQWQLVNPTTNVAVGKVYSSITDTL